jgi:hypothetical protein
MLVNGSLNAEKPSLRRGETAFQLRCKEACAAAQAAAASAFFSISRFRRRTLRLS